MRVFVASVILFIVQSWLVMIVLGAIHHSISDSIPALGFNVTMWVVVVVNFFRWTYTEE